MTYFRHLWSEYYEDFWRENNPSSYILITPRFMLTHQVVKLVSDEKCNKFT